MSTKEVDKNKFPKMVYKTPGSQEFQNGQRADTEIAYNEEGLKDLLDGGWSESLEEAADAHEASLTKKESVKTEEKNETAKQKAARLKAEKQASDARLKLIDEAIALEIDVQEDWDNETIEAKIAEVQATKLQEQETQF